ncbi:copper amine oxidase N-terminal domain-containing protein [Thermosyntropha sp.]|uniref:copper amine oxidase N-terminal domain-containing protein n=1 Tax=Thermosyntropha sp. TaxID=2740820 RepID=UPI0025D4861D|nr:copper amine oxidase N-terminal domain-containing protein [Thermosyntropha sp.]MBO8158755.1 copper amine oxidase N-terminal domain-containing protein [Thermosyntropha sp.]
MKQRVILLSVMFVLLLFTAPVLAVGGGITIEINGSVYTPEVAPVLENGITYVDLASIEKIIGADIEAKGNSLTIVKNQNVLKLQVPQNSAYLNDNEIKMPAAPFIKDGEIMVPLRFTLENLGAQIGWDQTKKTVTVAYKETRNGMSADELLVKSSEKLMQFNTYKMSGDIKTDMEMLVTGEETASVNIGMNIKAESFYQKEPLVIYTKQKISMSGQGIPAELQDMTAESVLKEDVYYTKLPNQGWGRMDLSEFNFKELIEQYNTQDPATMLKMMKDFGINSTFGNDITIGGKEYWVIISTLDKAKFAQEYQKMLEQLAPGMPGVDVNQLMNKTDFNIYYYKTYINKQSLLSEMIEMKTDMRLNLKNSEPTDKSAENIKMNASIEYNIKMSDFDKPFTLPDLSSAIDMDEILSKTDVN